MEKSTHNQLVTKIARIKKGSLLFPPDFSEFGSSEAVRKALSRLAKSGLIERLSHGIYLYPEKDPELGILYPSMEAIAESIAKRDKARIMPTDLYALHKLGLTTQVPMRIIYLTDAAPRKIKVGKRTITFKNASPKKLSVKGQFSGLVLQALQAIGKTNISEDVIKKITPVLLKEKKSIVLHDIKLAPAWIAQILKPIVEQNS